MLLRTICLILIIFPSILSAAPPAWQPVSAQLVRPRDGLGNVAKKLSAGETVKIAYLGGSITAAPGWRVKTREWFAKEYPSAKVEEIHAAIGGTGSDLGVYRVERDALKYQPDLLFVEFAVNDDGGKSEKIWRGMEGIVRKTWAMNPRTDICFVYTFKVGYEKDLDAGMCPSAASAMELLADHYKIPSVNFAKKVVELQQAGKLIYQSNEPTPEGVIRFSQDGVHPLDEGHTIYADVFAKSFSELANLPATDHGSKLSQAFIEDHWQAAKMVALDNQQLTGDWKALEETNTLSKSFSNRMGKIWEGTQPGSKCTVRFRGSTLKLYDLLGPDGGQVVVTIDGVTQSKPIPRFDSYCTYHRLATLTVAEGLDPAREHTVTIEIHPDQPDRTPVAFRLKDPETELKGPKYQGTKIRIGQILVLGDVESSSS